MGDDTNPAPANHFTTAGHDGSTLPLPPQITSFTAKGAVPAGAGEALQVEEGASVDFTWAITGDVTALYIDGTEYVEGPAAAKGKPARPKLDPAAGTVTIAIKAKAGDPPATYTMRAQHVQPATGNEKQIVLESAADLTVSVHAAGEAVAPAATVSPPLHLGAVAVTSDNGDIYMDPPVRIIPQYGRIGGKQIAGSPSNTNLTWVENGCGPTSCTIILRWFAEDCAAGRVKFPAKVPKPEVESADMYPLVMADRYWPHPMTKPHGKVGLTAGGAIDNSAIWGMSSHWLKSGGDFDPAARSFYAIERTPTMSELRNLLTRGPLILGIGDPAPIGHFVVVQGVVGDALLIVDPGAVICSAMRGGKLAKPKAGAPASGGAPVINDWSHLKGKGYVEGTGGKSARETARVPEASQWPGGKAPDDENPDKGAAQCYCAVSGDVLARLLKHARNAYSLTYPEGPALTPVGGVVPPAQGDYVKTSDPAAPYSPDAAPPAPADAAPAN